MSGINMSCRNERNLSKIELVGDHASRSMRNHTVREAEVDVHPLMAMLLLMLDLEIIEAIPTSYEIAKWAYDYGRVRRR